MAQDPKNNRSKIIQLLAGGVTTVVVLQRGANWAIDRRLQASPRGQTMAGIGTWRR